MLILGTQKLSLTLPVAPPPPEKCSMALYISGGSGGDVMISHNHTYNEAKLEEI